MAATAPAAAVHISQISLILKNDEQLPRLTAEYQHHTNAGSQAAFRVPPKSGGNLDRERRTAFQISILDVAIPGRILEVELPHRRYHCLAFRVRHEGALHRCNDLRGFEHSFNLRTRIHDRHR